MTPRIVVVGSLNMDLVVQAPRHPAPGETLIGGPFDTIPGGKGANQAVAAARLGGSVTMIGCVGRDAFGDVLLQSLIADGVDVSRVERTESRSGVALITVSAGGENTIVVAPGANSAVTPEAVRTHADAIAGADALLLQLEIPLPAVAEAVRIAADHGVPVILNPAPAQPLPPSLLCHVTYLIPNQSEAAVLAVVAAGDDATGRQAAERLAGACVGQVVLTLGSQGALVVAPGEATSVPAFPVEVVDSTAAGDAFVAAFAIAITEGRELVEATRWGCAAGALACTVLGAQRSLPRRADVMALLAHS